MDPGSIAQDVISSAARDPGLGFRTLRVVGQRYRIVFSIDTLAGTVHVVAAGIRREGARDDVYLLAQKLVRLGLAPSSRPRRLRPGPAAARKKK